MVFTSKASRLACVCVVALGGCANDYSTFYHPAPWATPAAVAAVRVAPPPAEPVVERVAPPADANAYVRRGYALIGWSSFNSGQRESDSLAVDQGRKVGADLVVILDPRYTGSTTTSVPLTMPNTTTSYTSGTATAYGPAGVANAYGSSTTTTYGTRTTYIPVTVQRMDYGAGYFVKRHWSLGATWRELNDAERQNLQTNNGVVVEQVVDGTPAYTADILPGDIILAINHEPVGGPQGANKVLSALAGQKVVVSLYRRGQKLDKEVQLN